MSNEITNYLKFANVQMAAEAVGLVAGMSSTQLEIALKDGNNRSSKFTPTQATEFAGQYTVEAHQANQSTGFSGTLFKKTGTNEFVLSFRSTEFADDSARDNQATNGMEIRPFGWAFGQIDDMKKWVDGLYANSTIPTGASLSVTGYSLGGHLAAAFNLLYPASASATYTFNGAGVGKLNAGKSLSQVIAEFDARMDRGLRVRLKGQVLHSSISGLRVTAYGLRVRSCIQAFLLTFPHVKTSTHRIPRRALPRDFAGGSARGDFSG